MVMIIYYLHLNSHKLVVVMQNALDLNFKCLSTS